jgi:hypothetical protein
MQTGSKNAKKVRQEVSWEGRKYNIFFLPWFTCRSLKLIKSCLKFFNFIQQSGC